MTVAAATATAGPSGSSVEEHRFELDLPVDAEAVMTFSPSPSQSRPPAAFGRSAATGIGAGAGAVGYVDERAPLLGTGTGKKERKPFYRPRPLWIVPFALLSSIARGMTLAPRVQVYTQLSCNALHQNYNHTVLAQTLPSPSRSSFSSFTLTHHDLDYSMPLPILLFPDVPPSTVPHSQSAATPPVQDPSRACVGDPAVTASAARLQTAVMVTMGVLSALTTSFWGHFGEKHGRTKVMAASSFGLLVTDLAFLLAVQPSTSALHTFVRTLSPHTLLLAAPVVEGLLGGFTTLAATTSAYVSDCTSDGSRASIFSRVAGVSYAGLALGPALGAQILRHSAHAHAHPPAASAVGRGVEGPTDGVAGVGPLFVVAIACTVLNFFFSVFLFPESVHKARRRAATKAAAVAEEATDAAQRSLLALQPKPPGFAKRLFGPLAVFAPSKALAAVHGRSGRDWSLTWLGIGLLCVLLSAGIFQIKYIFAEHVYGWNSEQLSYYVTFVGGLRAVNMLVVMPFIIARFKPKPSPDAASALASASATIAFDLRVARTAVFLDILSHTLVLLPTTSGPASFCAFTGLSSLAAAVVPATQSLALALFGRNPRNAGVGAGALFGAISAIQALGQMILGPLLFGMVYSATAATFPKAIFAVASALVTVGFAAFLLIRTGPPREKLPSSSAAAKRKGGVVVKGKGKAKAKAKTPLRPAHERGRSRVVKHVGDRHTGQAAGLPPAIVVVSSSVSEGASSSSSSSGAQQAGEKV